MEILSHRGFWKTKNEQNTKIAFERAFQNSFGVETDIRDCGNNLVISHDIPDGSEMTIEEFFTIYNSFKSDSFLALNIKADGLQEKLHDLIIKFHIKNYFVFDMSVPDSIGYLNKNFNFFTRQSEFNELNLYDKAQGVWMDCFESDWIEKPDIIPHINNGKKVCVVSPELHKRSYDLIWKKYIKFDLINNQNFMICTDYPDKFKLLVEKSG